MHKRSSLQNLIASISRRRLSRFLILAAALHLLFAVAINVAGRYRLLPNNFDENGIGISFAADSAAYLDSSKVLVNSFERDGVRVWIKDSAALHVKLYSLCYVVTRGLTGYTTLGAEPLNLFYYLLILSLVFALGREVFDRGTGILAAGITGLWPSVLLHTTQLLRDPLFLIMFLSIILVCTRWLTRTYSWQRGLMTGIAGGLASAMVWLVRSQMWEVLLCAVFLSASFLTVRQLVARRLMAGNLISAALLCFIMIAVPAAGKAFNIYSYPVEQVPASAQAKNSYPPVENNVSTDKPQAVAAQPILPPGSPLPARISFLRKKFLFLYPEAGSNIDTGVEFHSLADILLYLPRAMMIGLFAPFPNMWFVRGMQVGLEGRLLSGFETFLIYLVEALAAFALWRSGWRLQAWLLLLISLEGLLALGLVVPNLGALYRMRYGFWLLLIVLGAEGLRQLFIQYTPEERELDKSPARL